MKDLLDRLTAAIDETEMTARAALAGYASTRGYDDGEPAIMSSVWQPRYHEVFQVMTEEPSAEFIARHLPGANLQYRKLADCGPANVYPAKHIARHDPASVLRACAADRKMLDELAMRINYTPSTDRDILNQQQIRASDAEELLEIMAERLIPRPH